MQQTGFTAYNAEHYSWCYLRKDDKKDTVNKILLSFLYLLLEVL